jgi:hypothetical protein
MKRRYNSYHDYLKERFGCRVNKVSLDMGFTCPNRDGSLARGGCVYCNNDSFVPPYARARYPMHDQLTRGMEYLRKRFKAEKFIVYFQAYTNTYGNVSELESMYREALKYEGIVGIAVGTRSDCVDEEKIEMFGRLAKECYVSLEYGIESIYDKSLEFMNRGHDYNSVVEALQMSRGRGFELGAHIILGLPTETKDEMLAMADEVSSLPVDCLKIHNLHIVKGTPLARMYRDRPFELFGYEEYVDFLVRFIERLSPDVIIERFFTDTPRSLLVAPGWNRSHIEVIRGIEQELERRDTYQGRLYSAGFPGSVTIADHCI